MMQPQVGVQSLTDEELIQAFQSGNERAFQEIVGRFKNQLMNFAFRYLGNYDEADDIVQEAFVRVYHKKHLYKPIAKFSTWIYTIVTNLAKTQLQRRKRENLFSLSRQSDDKDYTAFELPDADATPDIQADRTIKHEIVQRALNEVSITYREILILCDVQGLSYEEISSITGLNIGTVKSRLHRGRTQLFELLKEFKSELDI